MIKHFETYDCDFCDREVFEDEVTRIGGALLCPECAESATICEDCGCAVEKSDESRRECFPGKPEHGYFYVCPKCAEIYDREMTKEVANA